MKRLAGNLKSMKNLQGCIWHAEKMVKVSVWYMKEQIPIKFWSDVKSMRKHILSLCNVSLVGLGKTENQM